jgi:hypothetical protein
VDIFPAKRMLVSTDGWGGRGRRVTRKLRCQREAQEDPAREANPKQPQKQLRKS